MLRNSQKIKKEEGDASEFIDQINKIISLLVFQFSIDEISLVRIKNWFDHKWLNYSGKSVIHFEKSDPFSRHAALQDEWREKITVPPFHPNKVISEIYVRKRKTGNSIFEQPLHTKKCSNDNIHNRIKRYTENGLFVWFSSNTEKNKRGSLMVYKVQDQEIETWYASFEKDTKWKVNKTKGINLNEIVGMIK